MRTCENITFLQLRWRAIKKNSKQWRIQDFPDPPLMKIWWDQSIFNSIQNSVFKLLSIRANLPQLKLHICHASSKTVVQAWSRLTFLAQHEHTNLNNVTSHSNILNIICLSLVLDCVLLVIASVLLCTEVTSVGIYLDLRNVRHCGFYFI